MNFLNSKTLTALLLLLSVWILFSVISAEVEKDEVKKEETAVENKIVDVKRSNELLEKYIINLKNPDFLDKEARLRLNYKALGEEVVFVYREINPKTSSSGDEFDSKNLPVYKKLWYWLTNF